MSFTPIPENSAATPGLWNSRFQELDTTISTLTAAGTTFGSTTTFDATVKIISPAVTHNLDMQGGNIFLRQTSQTTRGFQTYAQLSGNSFQLYNIGSVHTSDQIGLILTPGTSVTPADGRNCQIILYGVPGANYERFGLTYFTGQWTLDSTALGSGTTRPIVITATNGNDVVLQSTGTLSLGTTGYGYSQRFNVQDGMQADSIRLSGSTGTLNLQQGRLLSVRTIAAGGSATSANMVNDELCFQFNASGASLAIRSGGTVWYFSSSLSTKG